MTGEKQVTACGKLWYREEDKKVSIGFMPGFLEQVRECWHVTPAALKRVNEKSPLLSVETDDALFSVHSPVSGEIYTFNDKASNFPDQLTEEDVVCVIGPERAKAASLKGRTLNWDVHLLDDLAQRGAVADVPNMRNNIHPVNPEDAEVLRVLEQRNLQLAEQLAARRRAQQAGHGANINQWWAGGVQVEQGPQPDAFQPAQPRRPR
jgi:glycine cleavage system H lipoate-binding protein